METDRKMLASAREWIRVLDAAEEWAWKHGRCALPSFLSPTSIIIIIDIDIVISPYTPAGFYKHVLSFTSMRFHIIRNAHI